MPKLPGVNHLDAIRAHKPIKAFTMARIVHDAGMTVEEFRKLL